MDIKVDIKPEDVNKAVADAILKSAIGKQLEECINKSLTDMSSSWNNPLKPIIEREICALMRDVIREKYADRIKKLVEEKLTDKLLSDVADASWNAFENKLFAE